MSRLKYFLLVSVAVVVSSLSAQTLSADYVANLNKSLPHKFKEIRTGSTIEAIRSQEVVKVYVLIDDIEEFEQVLIERSDESGTNFGQCKLIKIERGKYPKNYIEISDRYPLSSKMSNVYRIKTITSDGIIRTYAPVPITNPDTTGIVQK